VSADVAQELQRETKTRERVRTRVGVVLALGPLTSVAGIAWAVLQPWRLTLLHPTGQGFWWLFAEPPIYVVLVGLLFRFVIAPGIAADLEERG
jgi:hypothetical protein